LSRHKQKSNGTEISKIAKQHQESCVPQIGTVVPSVGANILEKAKEHQEGRAPQNGAIAPRQE